ncbi:hypothetical protein [Cryobacterium tagatosivorans]|uniref:DUF320 domain-containing protein n=1 Tax=Cryobacterium tagatosivorans TaxID=1259199 RepID=A0A4R8UDP4_9MICO|nr:hypothetical protein [Cryobacterium tagatosivorans]TFB47308.1 hypothetical protein E3O23_15765 [Cryobacterium tagatosivorans]
MKNITKKISVFGAAGAAATALIVGGMIAPAQASTLDDAQGTSANSATTQGSLDSVLYRALSGNAANGNGAVVHGPVLNGPVVDRSLTSDVGDVASGNAVASGNDVPIASGNDTSVNAPVTAPVTATVDAPVGSANDTDLGGVSNDIGASVSDTVDGALGDLDLGAVLGD